MPNTYAQYRHLRKWKSKLKFVSPKSHGILPKFLHQSIQNGRFTQELILVLTKSFTKKVMAIFYSGIDSSYMSWFISQNLHFENLNFSFFIFFKKVVSIQAFKMRLSIDYRSDINHCSSRDYNDQMMQFRRVYLLVYLFIFICGS